MGMIKLKTVCITALLIGGMSMAFGQTTEYSSEQGSFRINSNSDGLKGTPYMFEVPQKGKISVAGGKIYEDIPFNILLEKNEVFIHMSGAENPPLAVKNWEWITTSEGNPRTFRKEIIEAQPKIVEILYESQSEKIVAVHRKVLVKPQRQKDGYSGSQYDTYQPTTKFLRLKGLQVEEVKFNTAGLKEISGDNFNNLKQYMKDENLDSKKPQDLRLILEFINK